MKYVLVLVLLLAGCTQAAAPSTNPSQSPAASSTAIASTPSPTCSAMGKRRAPAPGSVLTRSARKGGPREQDWVGSRSGNKKISEKERREALLECFARTNDVTCLDDEPTLQDPRPLTGPVARATSAPPGAARDGGHRWIRTKLTRCVSSSPELRRLPYQPWRPWRDHGTS